MPIRYPTPPPPVLDALGARPEAGFRGAAPVPAQPVFTVGLEEVLEEGAEAERSVSTPPTWRLSRFDSAGQPQVLELPEEDAGRGSAAAGDDRFGPMIREALAVADQDPRVGRHDYDARLYRVPALSLLAVWLHTAAALDLFVPIGRTPPGLEPNRVYDDGEFMTQVRRAANQVRGAYDEADAPDELGS